MSAARPVWICIPISICQFLSPFHQSLSSLPKSSPSPSEAQSSVTLPFTEGEGCQQKNPASSGLSEHRGCQMCFPVPRTVGLRSSIILYPTIVLMGEKPVYLDAPRQYAKSLLLEWQQRQCLSELDLVACFEWIEFYRNEKKEWWGRCCACIRLRVCFPAAQKERKSGRMGHP